MASAIQKINSQPLQLFRLSKNWTPGVASMLSGDFEFGSPFAELHAPCIQLDISPLNQNVISCGPSNTIHSQTTLPRKNKNCYKNKLGPLATLRDMSCIVREIKCFSEEIKFPRPRECVLPLETTWGGLQANGQLSKCEFGFFGNSGDSGEILRKFWKNWKRSFVLCSTPRDPKIPWLCSLHHPCALFSLCKHFQGGGRFPTYSNGFAAPLKKSVTDERTNERTNRHFSLTVFQHPQKITLTNIDSTFFNTPKRSPFR